MWSDDSATYSSNHLTHNTIKNRKSTNKRTMSNNRAIGVFDSGMGGLSVWRELRKALPEESIVYLADGKNCPYGDKPVAEVAEATERAVEELLRHDVKLIVVACNTATAVAIESLRSRYPQIPFVGMEPAVKPAALSSKSGTIGILATRAALGGELFHNSCERYGHDVRILAAVGEGFVEAVEEGAEADEQTLEAVRRAVEPLVSEGADKIVLGCTHYPFLKAAIEQVVSNREVEIIDPAPAVARRTKWLIEEHHIAAQKGHKADYSFLTFGNDAYLVKLTNKAASVAFEPHEQE